MAPEQHGVAASQAAPRAAQQRPLTQLPLQHSAVVEHAAPGVRHGPQRDATQIEVPQQLPLEVHSAPSCPQQVPLSQKPEQQSIALAQEAPTASQTVVAQTPCLQLVPAQHSASVAHALPAAPQSQIPPRHVSCEQQSRSCAQALPRSEQVQTPLSQCSPLQQSVSAVHVKFRAAHGTQLPD